MKRYAKRKASKDYVAAGPAIYSDENFILNVTYQETSKHKNRIAKPIIRKLKKAKTFLTSDGRTVRGRISKSGEFVKPKPKPKAKPRRASTKTTVVNGVTRIRKVHKAPKQNVVSWHSKLSNLDRERMLAIKAQDERLANQ